MAIDRDVMNHVGHDVMYSELGWTNWETAINDKGEVILDQVTEWNDNIQESQLICFDCEISLTGWQV